MEHRLSVIIPVHNGQKFLQKRINNLLSQSLINKEIIFVENGSRDSSWKLLLSLKEKYPNIIIERIEEKGTTWARKRGIELASGDYITFSDQDDCYVNSNCLRDMLNSIVQEKCQICQFGYYKSYGIIKRKIVSNHRYCYTRNELLEKGITSIVCSYKGDILPNVWTKVYDAGVLKSILPKITDTLFYCEDMYLNNLVFFNPLVQKVAIRPDAYYVWKVGVGTSGATQAEHKLFCEYQILKPLVNKLIDQNDVSEEIKYLANMDVLWFFSAIIRHLLDDHIEHEEILKRIELYDSFEFVRYAKALVAKQSKTGDVPFLSSQYSPEEYLLWQLQHYKPTLRYRIMKMMKDKVRLMIRKLG